MKSPCDFVWKARDNQPKPLTRLQFESFLNGSDVKILCDIIRQHKPNAEAHKLLLPAVTWQAEFKGKLRSDANAIPTGLFCLDVDIHHEPEFKNILQHNGIEAAYAWAEQEAKERAERWAKMAKEDDMEEQTELNIVGIHISPSGTGVHVVASCHPSCNSIAENQARLAKLLSTSYDEVCKDWARIFFLTPRGDWTYLDLDNIFGYEE